MTRMSSSVQIEIYLCRSLRQLPTAKITPSALSMFENRMDTASYVLH